MGRIGDLRKQAQRRTGNVYDTLFTRPVSIYFTIVFRALGVSANAVSVLRIPVSMVACWFLAFGLTASELMIGAGLIHLQSVLDSVDGELARLDKNFSLKGLFLEDLSAYLLINGFWLAIGVYLARTTGSSWPLSMAVALVAFFRNVMPVARRAILKSIETRRPVAPRTEASGRAGGGGTLFKILKLAEHLLHYTYTWIVLSTLVVIEGLGYWREYHLVQHVFTVLIVLHAAREGGIFALHLFTDKIDRDLMAVYDRAAQVPTAPVDAFVLSGDKHE
ncbi:MAG: CDP-alcohol phosphatidyltransferase family protein [Polyangiaceae bacterium]|nr:CDP-alcohol phosphatidyltransferase family protein [Polyangiaceae bacterium]